jgi:hypothetical protein
MEEVMQLQDELHSKIDAARSTRHLSDVDDYQDRIHDRMRSHREERYHSRRLEDRSGTSRHLEDVPPIDTSGLSDERAIYHMTQISRKGTIITDKFARFPAAFTSAEVDQFTGLLEEYKVLEKVVAGYLQQTADEFNKARKMKTKDQRLAQIERAKSGKHARKDDESMAREAARLKWVALKQAVDKVVDAYRAQTQEL